MGYRGTDVYEVESDDHVKTVESFKSACESGAYIDSDGFGYAIRANDVTVADPNTQILPSQRDLIPSDVTHVVWFNR